MAKTRNYAKVLAADVAADPKLARALDRASVDSHLAQIVYDARIENGWSIGMLAGRANTTPQIISDIEAADGSRITLSLLLRLAAAFGKGLQIDFCQRHSEAFVKSQRTV